MWIQTPDNMLNGPDTFQCWNRSINFNNLHFRSNPSSIYQIIFRIPSYNSVQLWCIERDLVLFQRPRLSPVRLLLHSQSHHDVQASFTLPGDAYLVKDYDLELISNLLTLDLEHSFQWRLLARLPTALLQA